MQCSSCKKEYDFTKITTLICKCKYCTPCLAKKLNNFNVLNNSIVKAEIECCKKKDYNFVFGFNSLIHEELMLLNQNEL